MSYYKYEDKNIYYEEHGNGEPLLLLHGNTVSSKFFDSLIPLLKDKYRVITLDFLGCGKSDRVNKWPADLWYEWSKQVKVLCNELNLLKIKLIGCSGGALTAINVALENPELIECVDADTEALVIHAKTIGNFFHKPIEDLKVNLLLTGSAEDEMFLPGHYENLFNAICSRSKMVKAHIFEHGVHPALMSNINEFIKLF